MTTRQEWAERWVGQQVFFPNDPGTLYLVTAVNLREQKLFVGNTFVSPKEVIPYRANHQLVKDSLEGIG